MRRRFKLIERQEEEGFVPVRAWCTGFTEGCVKSAGAYLRGDWVYVRTCTVYDEEGKARDLREPVYVRIGKLDRDDDWLPRRRAGRKAKKL